MNRRLLDELTVLTQRDLDVRSRLLREGRLYGDYAEEMQQVHRDNARRLDELVTRYGWPGTSVAGEEGCHAAWVIAQHSICTPDLQRRFLALLANAAAEGEVPMWQVAFLTDRIRFNERRPQVYGTVLDWSENGELSCDVDDRRHLDARRAAASLPPFRESLERYMKEVASEGGGPPENLGRYRKKQHAWARRVGWL